MLINQLFSIEVVLAIACIFMLFFHKFAHADPLLIADDASVSEKNTCHFESALHFHQSSGHALNFSPVCGLSNNFELSLGLNQTELDHDQAISVQLKHGLKPIQAGQLGAAVSLMLNQDLNNGGHTEWGINLPITYALFNDRVFINSNISYQDQSDHQFILGAISTSYLVTDKSSLSFEVFNQDHQSAFYQTVLGYELIKNTLTVEASYADRFRHRQDRWIGLGLSYTPAFK